VSEVGFFLKNKDNLKLVVERKKNNNKNLKIFI
jgi:hypothetical protein